MRCVEIFATWSISLKQVLILISSYACTVRWPQSVALVTICRSERRRPCDLSRTHVTSGELASCGHSGCASRAPRHSGLILREERQGLSIPFFDLFHPSTKAVELLKRLKKWDATRVYIFVIGVVCLKPCVAFSWSATMVTDHEMATQGFRISPAIVGTYFSWNIKFSITKGLF